MTHSKILIITSSGGGGLLQTANAKEQAARAKNPHIQIIRKDLLKDWIWKPMGRFFINFWNRAQKSGDVGAQKICVDGQFLVDIFLHPIIFCYALYTLLKEDVDHIIDTQPLGTSAILKAVRIVNKYRNKQIRLEKVLVDLPTKKATHFFGPIKKLSKNNRARLLLTTIAPYLEKGETNADFWQKNCRLPESQIQYEDVYVRQAFLQYKGKGKAKDTLNGIIRFKSEEEKQLIQKASEKGFAKLRFQENEVHFSVEPKDQMITILLGSQPAGPATLNYVKKFVSLAKEIKQKTYIFVFCADHQAGQKTLFQIVADFAGEMGEYPSHFSIIPFSFQKEDVIAPLFYRSDITCTRSGGQTAMELMCVSTGQILIHSEAKHGKNPTLAALLKGIPGWEAASALYLQTKSGAEIVTPEMLQISNGAIHSIGCK